MNYNKPELLDALAGQYVLGTLRGLARKRFQRLLLNSNQAREATNMWEQNLNNLASAITPQTPRDDVWVNILQRIALVQNQDKQSLWFIDVSEQGLSIRASSQLVAQTNKDYELWMILKGQDAPISLGLLPKQGSKILFKDNRFNASDVALLAVSLEPIGGSPNGSPTEVLYTTELVLL